MRIKLIDVKLVILVKSIFYDHYIKYIIVTTIIDVPVLNKYWSLQKCYFCCEYKT